MNRMALSTFALVLFSGQVSGATLNELINQNVRDATRTYEKTLPPAQQPATPAQLWIHVRNDGQKQLAQEILDKVAKTGFRQSKVEQKPIQKVDSGPGKSQLRYFKRQDQTQARELFDMLRTLIPQLELSDVSGKYESVGWIKSGHYELWLSPDTMRLQPE
jgi:hypothetical protein